MPTMKLRLQMTPKEIGGLAAFAGSLEEQSLTLTGDLNTIICRTTVLRGPHLGDGRTILTVHFWPPPEEGDPPLDEPASLEFFFPGLQPAKWYISWACFLVIPDQARGYNNEVTAVVPDYGHPRFFDVLPNLRDILRYLDSLGLVARPES